MEGVPRHPRGGSEDCVEGLASESAFGAGRPPGRSCPSVPTRGFRFMKRWHHMLSAMLAALCSVSCEDSETDRIDPPLSELGVAWDRGFINANFFPPHPPDPVRCNAWLIFESSGQPFSSIEVPTADVVLVRNDSTVGTIPLQTDWDGILGSGEIDTVLFFKEMGNNMPFFDPPCDDRVFLDFLIRNADGESMVFRPDTLDSSCTY